MHASSCEERQGSRAATWPHWARRPTRRPESAARAVVASVPRGEGCEGVGVGRASVQEVVRPLGDVGVGRVLAELGGCGLEVEVHGADVGIESVEDFLPAVEAGVDQDNLLVVARGGMAEQHLSEPMWSAVRTSGSASTASKAGRTP